MAEGKHLRQSFHSFDKKLLGGSHVVKQLLAFKLRLIVCVALVLSSMAFAQNGNCSYTFTWPNHSFSFCVSQYGTLAMLQAPIGVDHLDPVNPVEGWRWAYWPVAAGSSDMHFDHTQITGIGYSLTSGTFTQPNGPGTLPLIFHSDYWADTVTFTANAAARTVIIKTQINVSPAQPGAYLDRYAVFKPGGNPVAYFSTTGFSAYEAGSYGIRLTTSNGTYGVEPRAPSVANVGEDPCLNRGTFTGTGSICASRDFSDKKGWVTLQVKYSVF
jgi:hypothetical protein